MATSRCSCSCFRNLQAWKSMFICRRQLTTSYFSSPLNRERRNLCNRVAASSSPFPLLQNSSQKWTSSLAEHSVNWDSALNSHRLRECSSLSAVNTGGDQNKDSSQSAKDEERKKKDDFQRKATKYTLVGLGILCSVTSGYLIAAWGKSSVLNHHLS